MKIINVSAYKILASLGNETLEAKIVFDNGQASMASVPAGISAGKYEVAKVSPDEAVSQINSLKNILSGKDWTQETLDKEVVSHGFGGNATLAVSAAFFKASLQLPSLITRFPQLMLLLFEGGKHGSPANKNLSIQEFLIIEETISSAEKSFKILRTHLEKQGVETLVGAEGGFSPANFDNDLALDTIRNLFADKKISLDVADCFNADKPPDFKQLTGAYNLLSIEDPYDDESWEKWQTFTKMYAGKILVVGDDLTATNPERIKKAIDLQAINAVVIKPNQIGTITLASQAIELARNGGLKVIVSHRGEETDDYWIVDFALAVKADYVKLGGMDRGERIAKYNRLKQLGMT